MRGLIDEGQREPGAFLFFFFSQPTEQIYDEMIL